MRILSVTIIFCITLIITNAFAQSASIRPSINKLAESIAKENVIKSSSVGYAGARPAQWDRFQKLCKASTNSELQELTNHANGVVRCYAFHALAIRKDKHLFKLLTNHLKDTATVETYFGCIVGSQKVGDYLIEVVTHHMIDLDTYKLTKTEQAKLDSILIFDKNITLSAKYNLLANLKPAKNYYSRIREIALSEKNPVAVLALSRYRNKNDIGVIQNQLKHEQTQYWSIYAIREFPDTAFYPALVTIFEKQWSQKAYDYPKWRILYQALAQYPTNTTKQLFERTLQTQDEFRYNTLGKYLLIALTRYPNPAFTSIKSKIKLSDAYSDIADEMYVEK